MEHTASLSRWKAVLIVMTAAFLTLSGKCGAETNGSFAKDELTGRFDPSHHPGFVELPLSYTGGANGMYLRRETVEAFGRMHAAALRDGVKLVIISATRNFDYQRGIWEAKWNGDRLVEGRNLARTVPDPDERALAILRYSSMPGTSRHHWGTDMDLNSLENSYFASGNGLKIYEWLKAHAGEYGFVQPYTAYGDGRTCGYLEEKWHWSYYPLSSRMLAAYTNEVTLDDINGFAGCDTALTLDVIKTYVLGVSEKCFLRQ